MKSKIKPDKINIIFMGTSDFAVKILSTLLERKLNLIAVYTPPDKIQGRKKILTSTPIKKFAKEKKLNIIQPSRFNQEVIEKLASFSPDLIVVADYGKILPKEVIKMPGFGCLNVHASLLPKFRGPSPIQNALWQGKRKTGITIMLMDEGIDTGDIIAQKEVKINEQDTALTLTQKLSEVGADLLAQTIPLWINQEIEPLPQDNSKATLCQIIEKNDGRIFFEKTAKEIYNQFRALYPWPGVFAFWDNGKTLRRIKFLKISYNRNNPLKTLPLGKVFREKESKKIGVQTTQGIVYLEKIQLESKFALPIEEFINGYPDFIGAILK